MINESHSHRTPAATGPKIHTDSRWAKAIGWRREGVRGAQTVFWCARSPPRSTAGSSLSPLRATPAPPASASLICQAKRVGKKKKMMPSSSTPAPKPGWVYDSTSGYYHNPSSGVYFDQQRGLYHAGGRWLSHAEYTARMEPSARILNTVSISSFHDKRQKHLKNNNNFESTSLTR